MAQMHLKRALYSMFFRGCKVTVSRPHNPQLNGGFLDGDPADPILEPNILSSFLLDLFILILGKP